MKRIFLVLISMLFLSFAVCAQDDPLDFGNPSKATANQNRPANFLVEHTTFTLSYNRARGSANWVAWHLDTSNLGDEDRSNAFAPDTLLPEPWRISGDTFPNLERGHMCPSGDRTKTPEENIETFVMSNMQPQTIRLNRGRWKNLEDFERDLVEQGDELYIYAGCFGGTRRTRQRVIVPKRCWKIILILPKGSNDLGRVTAATNVIAVSMPNTTTSSTDWTQFVSTVRAIEIATGFDFFSKLPDRIERAIEIKPSSKTEVLRQD